MKRLKLKQKRLRSKEDLERRNIKEKTKKEKMQIINSVKNKRKRIKSRN